MAAEDGDPAMLSSLGTASLPAAGAAERPRTRFGSPRTLGSAPGSGGASRPLQDEGHARASFGGAGAERPAASPRPPRGRGTLGPRLLVLPPGLAGPVHAAARRLLQEGGGAGVPAAADGPHAPALLQQGPAAADREQDAVSSGCSSPRGAKKLRLRPLRGPSGPRGLLAGQGSHLLVCPPKGRCRQNAPVPGARRALRSECRARGCRGAGGPRAGVRRGCCGGPAGMLRGGRGCCGGRPAGGGSRRSPGAAAAVLALPPSPIPAERPRD